MPRKLLSFLLCFCLLFTQTGLSQVLPTPSLNPASSPALLRYLSVNQSNPFNYFNFLLDKGDSLNVGTAQGAVPTLNSEAKKLINYFFLGITLSSESFWVNLRPDEPDRITSGELAKTDLGRTLLEQDLQLKKDASNYLHPANPKGREFWEALYKAIGKDKAKTAKITTSNRVWIVPDEAVVLETEDGALVASAKLKVLLENEYLAGKQGLSPTCPPAYQLREETVPACPEGQEPEADIQALSEQLMKQIILPALTNDINTSPNYAPLRQIYHSLILAEWFKRRARSLELRAEGLEQRDSLYIQAIDKGYTKGLESALPWEKQKLWQDYLVSYNQGEYNIKDTIFGLKRMYFSGGITFFGEGAEGVSASPLTIINENDNPEILKTITHNPNEAIVALKTPVTDGEGLNSEVNTIHMGRDNGKVATSDQLGLAKKKEIKGYTEGAASQAQGQIPSFVILPLLWLLKGTVLADKAIQLLANLIRQTAGKLYQHYSLYDRLIHFEDILSSRIGPAIVEKMSGFVVNVLINRKAFPALSKIIQENKYNHVIRKSAVEGLLKNGSVEAIKILLDNYAEIKNDFAQKDPFLAVYDAYTYKITIDEAIDIYRLYAASKIEDKDILGKMFQAYFISPEGFKYAIDSAIPLKEIIPYAAVFQQSNKLGRFIIDKYKEGVSLEQVKSALHNLTYNSAFEKIEFKGPGVIFVPARIEGVFDKDSLSQAIREGLIVPAGNLSALSREILQLFGINIEDSQLFLIPIRTAGSHRSDAADIDSLHNRSFFYDTNGDQGDFIFKGIGTAYPDEKGWLWRLPFEVGRRKEFFIGGRNPYLFRGGMLKEERKAQAFVASWLKSKFNEYFNNNDEFFNKLKTEGLDDKDIDMFFKSTAYFKPLLLPIQSANADIGSHNDKDKYLPVWQSAMPTWVTAETEKIDKKQEVRLINAQEALRIEGFEEDVSGQQEIFLYNAKNGHRISELVARIKSDGSSTGMYDIVNRFDDQYQFETPRTKLLDKIKESLTKDYGAKKEDLNSGEFRERVLKKLALKSLAMIYILWKEGYTGSTKFGNLLAPNNMSFTGFFDYDTIDIIGDGKRGQAEDIGFLLETLSVVAYSLGLQNHWLDAWGFGGTPTRTFFENDLPGSHPTLKFVLESLKDLDLKAYEELKESRFNDKIFAFGRNDSFLPLDIPEGEEVVDGEPYNRSEISVNENVSNSTDTAASPLDQGGQTAASPLKVAEQEMDNLAVNEIIKGVDGEILRNTNKLNESRARLEKFTEVGFAQGNSLVDKEQELIDNRKKSLEEVEGLRKRLEGVTDFNEVLNILQSYGHKPTSLQEEVLNATVRNVLEFNKNSVIFVDNPSALERIFSPGLKHAAETIILAEGVNERRAIILVSSDLTTASQLVMVLPHEAWHTKSALNYNNPIHRYLDEGITTYLEKKSIDKIIAEEPQIAELIEQELAHIKIPEIKIPETPEEKLRRVISPETQQERLFKKLYPSFDYKTEVITVVTLASKFGEPFIMHIYTTGDLSILKDELGERFDFLNSIASFSVPAWVEQWAVRNTLHFIFVDDSFNKTKLKAFKEVLTAIKYVTGEVYNKYCGSMDWDETQAYLKRLSAVIGSMDSIKKYTEARLAKKIDLKQLREGLGLEVKTFSEEFVRKLANGQNGKTSGSPVILPAFDKITKSILDYLPSDQKVIVNVQSNFESKEVTTTVADALAVAKDSGVVSVQIKRIPPVRANTVPVESAANKFEANWITQWVDDEVLNVMVQFASGQTAAFYGNKEMLLELANQSEVMRVIPSEAPQWMRTAYQTPQEERAANADWLGKLANGFGSGVVMTSQEANIAGMEVYHGTIASLADSAKAGPKNVGKGFGGRGLYLAAQGERDIAEYLASIAAIEHRDSVSYLSGEVAVNQNAGREPVILSGKINPKRQLRVGKFTVKGEVTIPDLINGVLPALWDNDPNLRVLLEREFDVLDLWDMHSSGLVIDTDHMLVVHERAGADAIIWEASSALNNLSGDKTGGIDGSTAPTINSSDKQGKGGIDLSNIELILKDDSYVSNLSPADIKVLRAAKALKDGWDSLSLLYIHEIILLLSRQAMKRQAGSRLLPDSFAGKDNLANGITNKALLSQVLKQLQTKDFLDPQALNFLNLIQSQKPLSEIVVVGGN